MLTFTGIEIEDSPYTIMMTSGNYRRMLNEWYFHFKSDDKTPTSKRNAQNYTIVVIAFILGAIILSFSKLFLGKYAIWIATITFFLSFSIGIYVNLAQF